MLNSDVLQNQVTKSVAFFLPSLAGGGAERVVVQVANGLAGKGFPVDLVLVDATGPYIKDVGPGVRVIDLGATRIRKSLVPLIRYLRIHKPFTLMATLDRTSVIAIWAKRLSRVRTHIVVRLANTLSQTYGGPKRAIQKSLFVSILKRSLPIADAIVAVSRGVADDAVHFCHLPKDKVTIINNPVAVREIQAKAEQGVEDSALFDLEKPIMVGIGRLTRQKGFDVLIKAARLVFNGNKGSLVIVGEGPDRSKLEALIDELGVSHRGKLVGFLDNPYPLMNRAAAIVLSSRWEGFPNVLLEAMALGVPMVATDCMSGPADILREGQLGELVPVDDVEKLAKAMTSALYAPRATGSELRSHAMEYDQESILLAYQRILRL